MFQTVFAHQSAVGDRLPGAGQHQAHHADPDLHFTSAGARRIEMSTVLGKIGAVVTSRSVDWMHIARVRRADWIPLPLC